MSSLARAIETGDVAELPSRREEDWHWTDLRGLIRKLPPRSGGFGGDVGIGPFDGLGGERLLVLNGRMAPTAGFAAPDALLRSIRVIGQGEGAHALRLARIRIASGDEAALVESYEGRGGYLSELDLSIEVEAGASLERVVLCDEPADAVSVSRAEIVLAPGARYAQTVIASGARRQRIEARVRHGGGGAVARLDGLYLLDGRRHSDLTTVVTHDRPGGVTDQLIKGAVRDQARGVFQGRIVVAAGADGTDAKMGCHALVLSDRAEVDAKPELEIYADDVACAHGATVGALDPDALFYAMQRGLPEPEARGLLIGAFLIEVVDRIGHPGAREAVRAWLDARLGAGA